MNTNRSDVGIRHGSGPSGGMATRNAVRVRLSDLAVENSPSVYIRTLATKILGAPAHVLMPHKSTQGGDVLSIEIPMTHIPIDLAAYAPKEELLRNTDLLKLLNTGVFELMTTEDAEKELSTPTAQHEIDRLQVARQARLKHINTPGEDDMAFRTMHPEINMPRGQPGDLNAETASVSASVVDIVMNADYSDDDRLVMLRNLIDILTDNDRRYIRSKTRDQRILELVG